MTNTTFVDWRNRQEKILEPPVLKHIERFQVLPEPKPISGYNVETLSFSFDGCGRAIKHSWQYCPSVNRTYLKPVRRYESTIARRYGPLSVFDRIQLANDGTHIGPREDKRVLHQKDNWSRCNAITSQLGLTNYQKARVQVLLNRLNLKKEGRGLDQVVFALSALVCREDGRRTEPSVKSDQVFREFATRQGWNDKKAKSLMRKCGSKWKEQLPLKTEKRDPPEEPLRLDKDRKKGKYWTVYTIESADKKLDSKQSI